MVTIDQKERYRRQAALCLEIAATMSGERAASMARLAETYAALAEDEITLAPPAIYVDPQCPRCGKDEIHAFDATHGRSAGHAGVPLR
jgi:predicted RNA-binding Zn-ribbon protein involved in translation (DUF1610 family)